MDLAVVGTGYVGLVAGACFADSGNRVCCVDCDQRKIIELEQGRVPIFEPGLAEIIQRNQKAGRLTFSTDLASAVATSRIIFLAVGTPEAEDGSADLSAIAAAAGSVGRAMDGHRVVAMKSTVPVGTHQKVSAVIAENTNHSFDYVSNPEFMKEGAAVDDFMKPDRVAIGTTSDSAAGMMKELYGSFTRREERILVTDPASAEMIKYAANALLAARISYMNELAGLCERFGADIESVRRGAGGDSRIGSAFLYPGVGYGGSCFPKDVSALISMGRSVDHPMLMTEAVHEVNTRQRLMFANRVIDHFGSACPSTTLAVWGLSFKSHTDDIRESPAIVGIGRFLESGMTVRAHDPEAMAGASRELGDAVTMCEDGYAALSGCDALVIFTDWPEFRTPNFAMMAERIGRKLIFDGRNLYDPNSMAQRGFQYYCIGRPALTPVASARPELRSAPRK